MDAVGEKDAGATSEVPLLEGFILLHALGDPIVTDEDSRGIDKLKRVRAMVFLRNNSIFVHGLGPVGMGEKRCQ